MTATPPIRVGKIGGSLLSLPDLPQRLATWLAKAPPMPTAFIIGGGQIIEAMRELDDQFDLDQTEVHWRCVRMLRHSFEVAAEICPYLQAIETPTALTQWRESIPTTNALVAIDCFYDRNTISRVPLPHSWETTTDSIAVELSAVLGACELVLFKSAANDSNNWREAAASGYVDNTFAEAASYAKKIRLVNLRQDLPG